MSEMVHIGGSSCSVDRRGSAGRICTVVPKGRKAVLKALVDHEWPSPIREANSDRIRTQRSTEIRRKNLGLSAESGPSTGRADCAHPAPPPTQQVPCRQSRVIV